VWCLWFVVGGLRLKVCASSAVVFVTCGAEGAGVVFDIYIYIYFDLYISIYIYFGCGV